MHRPTPQLELALQMRHSITNGPGKLIALALSGGEC